MPRGCVYVLLCLPWLCGQLILHPYFSSGEETNIVGLSQKYFTIDCDPQDKLTPSCHSLTLKLVAENVTEISHVHIDITTSQLELNGIVEFRGHQSVSITGDSTHATVISCTERDSGLVFTKVNKITIDNIILTKCATHYIDSLCPTALLILYCRHVLITNVSITKSKGRGLSFVGHEGGVVNILDSNFSGNVITSLNESNTDGSKLTRGGGVFIGLYSPSIMTWFIFENCDFSDNYAYTDEQGVPISVNSHGGGVLLKLEFEEAVPDTHFEFHKCTFIKNAGFLGGGLYAVIARGRQGAGNVTVVVRDSLFEANGCSARSHPAAGGGVHVSFNMLQERSFSHHSIWFVNVTFSSNCAEVGGGVKFYSNYREYKTALNSLQFDNCTFVGNQARIGTAIDLSPTFLDRSVNGFLLVPVIKDCQFISNKVVNSINMDTTIGTGTIYSSQYSINFQGHNVFRNNLATALYIVNGIADFSSGNVSFISNRGNRGGAVALIGLSSLLVGPKHSYNYVFIDNIADDSGGAIYSLTVDEHDYTAPRSCFIQYVQGNDSDIVVSLSEFEWEANITFIGNRAISGAGHSIFATSLYPCQINNGGTTSKYGYHDNVLVNISDALALRGLTLDGNRLLQPQVATDGAMFEVDRDLPLQIIPGQQYSHNISILDDLGNPAKTIIRASVSHNPSVRLGSNMSSCLTSQVTLIGEPKQTGQLLLHTMSQRQVRIKVEFELVSCPPGFKLDHGRCICNAQAFIGLLRCEMNSSFHSFLTTGFWIGLIEDVLNSSKVELVTALCPSGFCDYNNTHSGEMMPEVKLPQNSSVLDEAICGKSRTGVICGDCRYGYTTRFHSPKFLCKPVQPTMCKIGWLFYVLSELVPVTIVFLSVLALNINFTSGSVNGFILFCQLINSVNIDAGGLTPLSRSLLAAVQGYKIMYGFFNLDYFNVETLSFCLWTNASALDMIAFKYVTIVYALFLIFIVVWFMNKCGGRCLGKWCRITKLNSSVTHGMATFLVMSYAQCMNVSLTLLLQYRYDLQEGSQLNTRVTVWMNGNLPYFGARHLMYALPALACILTIGILPIIFLLFYPLACKVIAVLGFEENKIIRFISDKVSILKPILDSFQGCFNDNMRFFAGLYFVYRWINLAAYTTTSSYSSYYTVVEVLLLCMLALHAIFQPYLVRMHNTIDALLFTNMAIINAIAFANYYRFRNYGNKLYKMNNVLATVQLVLIYIPVVVYITAIVCQCCIKCRKRYPSRLFKKYLSHPSLHGKIQQLKLSKFFSSTSNVNSEELSDDEYTLPNSDYRYMH